MPSATARHTKHLSLFDAFTAHVLAALLTMILLSLLMWADGEDHPLELFGELLSWFQHRPEEMLIVSGIFAFNTEVGFLLLALLLLPWGARDERLRDSFRNSLRQTWIHTGHALPAVLLVGVLAVLTNRANTDYWQNRRFQQFHYDVAPPSPPSRPVGAPYDSKAARDYREAHKRYQMEMAAYNQAFHRAFEELERRQKPFLMRYGPGITVNAGILTAVWILWSLIRAVSADRGVPPRIRPPLCETCGYNLTSAPPEGRCPECGRAVAESLDPARRPGTPWERRRELGLIRAYAKTLYAAFLKPGSTGESLQVLSFREDHRLLMALHLLWAFGIGIVGGVTAFRIGGGLLEDLWLVLPPLFSTFAVLWLLGCVCLCAVIVAVNYRLRTGRNLAHTAIRVASHHSFWLIPWAITWAALVILLAHLDRTGDLRRLSQRLRTIEPFLVASSILFVNLAFGLLYLRCVWKGTATARFANR